MRKVWKEIAFDVRKAPYLFVLLLIQLIVYFGIFLSREQIASEIGKAEDMITYRLQETQYYRLVDNLMGEYEEAFLKNKDALAKLKMMYHMLSNNSNFEYLEIYNNPVVLIGDNIRDEFLYRYEEGDAEQYRGIVEGQFYNEIKCCFISCNVGDLFDIQCHQGAFWKEDEKNNETVPIVLGSGYSGIFEVGDYIQGITPFHENAQFEVYGILDEGEYLIYNDRIQNLDRYVLVPLQDAETLPEAGGKIGNQIFLYLCKTNGTLASTLPPNDLQDIVQEICDICGITPSSTVAGSTNAQSHILKVSMDDILRAFKEMLFILNVFSIVSTILYILLKINKNQKYYGILMLNGFSVMQVFLILLGSVILSLILAEVAAILLCYCLSVLGLGSFSFPVLKMVVANMEIVAVAGIIGFMKIRKLDLQICMEG
ncbi:MAG: hypothetical protein K2I22_00630 [Lachnospiraceae bacterium]|nr:hypothetical protein [Lachnospiraceae bacterium]